MLKGCVAWPADVAHDYRHRGLWEGVTLWSMFERAAARAPDRIALVYGTERYSYGAVRERACALSNGFRQAGLRALDRVVLQLPNVPAFVFSYLALQRIGAIPVMALRAHRKTEVTHFVKASAAVAYIVPEVLGGFDYRDMAREVARDSATLRCVLVDGSPLAGQRSLLPLLDDRVDGDEPANDADEVATMLLSGGTTSMSKLIPRTHNDYVLNARLCSEVAGFTSDTVHLVILPLGHNYNLASPGMLGVFYRGGTVVLAPSARAADVFPLIERERVTSVAAVVPLIVNWLQADEVARHDLSSLDVVQNGGARLQPELRRRLRDRLGCIPQEIYGTAEGLINMTRLGDNDDLLLESSGAPVSGDDEIRVVDDDGRDVDDGEPGELLTRGPYTIRGYYDAPQKNAEAFTDDGFYRMGDIVRKRGRYVFAEGRKKDFINRGGEKISCEEVEGFIIEHPAVKSVTLVAMPDHVFGEKACAFVILRDGATLTFDALIGFLRSRDIASFKLPERLEIVEAFPVSPVGKIMKRELKDALAATLAPPKDGGT
ncbi:MAG TPA: AMP-binding protein [Casimicrobiaceae bacterium]|nr:AMP-binding protein [Casimicrobiaceae bacterium]